MITAIDYDRGSTIAYLVEINRDLKENMPTGLLEHAVFKNSRHCVRFLLSYLAVRQEINGLTSKDK